MQVLDLEFEALVEFADMVVQLYNFAVLVQFLLDLVVKGCHEGTEESNGVIIGF